jgi:hypothetical protein
VELKNLTIRKYLEALREMMKDNPNAREFYEWVLREGREFKPKDFGELTKEEKRTIEDIKPCVRPKQCYYVNQILAIEDKKIQYYEGWVIDKKIPIPLEHSWALINGKIVDLVSKKIRNEPIEYFGVHVPTIFIAENMVRTGMAQEILGRFFFSKKEKSKDKLKEII